VATVTKAALAKYLADQMGFPKARALEAVDLLFQAMAESIIQGNRIEIRGLGSWEVKETKEKAHARNPSTGERVYVPARRKVMFKPGKILKDVLSQPLGEPAQAEPPPPPQTEGAPGPPNTP
jgi:nucleoid DNA-binding protein